MKKAFLLTMFSITLSVAYSQINLPLGFTCVVETFRDKYFINGNVKFWSDCDWGQVYGTKAEFEKGMQESFPYLKKTSDGLLWGTTTSDGYFYYQVAIPESKCMVSVRSTKDDQIFSGYSVWLLAQVRSIRKSTQNYDLYDHKGKACQ